jgi:tetratricopeptide (TPR) repeat protein
MHDQPEYTTYVCHNQVMVSLLVVVALAGAPQPAPAGVADAPTERQSGVASSYYEFIRARHLESEGDIDGAVAALRRAAVLDPQSAEVHAEMASLFARHNRGEDAMAAAERALAIDPENSEANWVVGMINAALARSSREGKVDAEDDRVTRAIAHLEKAASRRSWDPGVDLTLGRLYLQIGAHDKAITRLSGLVSGGFDVADAALLLAEAYERANEHDRALKALESVTEEDPLYARAQEMKAGLSERRGDFVGAADAYGRALAVNPTAEELRFRRASALIRAGNAAEARQILTAELKDDPGDAQALYLLVQAEQEAGDLEAAEATARRLGEVEPKSLRGALALAHVFEARREYARVVSTLAPIVESGAGRDPGTALNPALTSAMLRLAYARQQVGETAAAVALFEEIKARSAPSALNDAYLAQALIAARAYARALETAEAARARWPDDERLIRLHAESLSRLGRPDPAIALLEAQASQNPGDSSHAIALAALLAENKRFDRAETVLKEAASRAPKDIALTFQLGAVYEQAGDNGRAEQAFREVLALDPSHAPTLNYLGYMFAERGERLDEAVRLLEHALRLDPHNGSYLDSLGWAYFKQKKLDLARAHLSRAAEQLGTNSVVQDHLGDLLFALEERDDAIAAWQRALAGDGESIERTAIERKIQRARER